MEGTTAFTAESEKHGTGQLDPELRKAVQAAAKDYLLQELDINATFQQLKKSSPNKQDDAEAVREAAARKSNKGVATSKDLSPMALLIQQNDTLFRNPPDHDAAP